MRRAQGKSARPLRLDPLAACLMAVFGLGEAHAAPANPAHPANVIVVTNCLDSGAGSLRAAVQSSGDGDDIDLTQLPCSQITLTSGRIDVSHALLLQGPGSGLLTIDGARTDRIFNQNANEELAIYGMTLQNGYSSFFGGGCVYSSGTVALNDTVVTGCKVFDFASSANYKGGGLSVVGDLIMTASHVVDNEIYASLGGAFGGGVSVTGTLALFNSTISGNSAQSTSASGVVRGGGADVGGTFISQYSTISDNRAYGLYAGTGSGGGARVLGVSQISNSTISGNGAGSVGGLFSYGYQSTIVDSTISDNTAVSVGGIYSHSTIQIANSTIAFNSETNGLGAGLRQAYGVADLESTIVASNSGSVQIDLGISGGIGGSSNLIGPSGAVTLPPGTIQSDPRLAPLANNGGPTQTHELLSGSPAIDAGNNNLGLSNDQRGTGFPRLVGGGPDIGAVEANDDLIFANGFD